MDALVAVMFTSCEKEKVELNRSKAVEISYSTEVLKTDFVPKKTGYKTEWGQVRAHTKPYHALFYPIHEQEFYYTVILTSSTGEKQEWLLQNVATEGVARCHRRSDDPEGKKYGFYYAWEAGADLSYRDIEEYVINGAKGFHIPTSDDLYKLHRIVGSREECAKALFLTDNQVYSSVPQRYTTMIGPAFWFDDANMAYPEVGSLYTFTAEGANGVAGTILRPNAPGLHANIRLVRNL